MGNESSSTTSAKDYPQLSGFSETEKSKFHELFATITKGSEKLVEDALQIYLKKIFSRSIISRLFCTIAHHAAPLPIQKPQTQASEANFCRAVASLVNGTVDQQAHMIRHLSSTHPVKELTAKELYAFVKEILTSYYAVLTLESASDMKIFIATTPEGPEVDLLAFASLCDLFYPDRKKRLSSDDSPGIPDTIYSNEDLKRWISDSQLFSSSFTYVFQRSFPVRDVPAKSLLPMFVGKSGTVDHVNLLSVAGVTVINQAIPLKLREKWTLLFDSRKHGESFTTLLRNVKQRMNTVLVVRDSEGNVFGGFSTAAWSNHAHFQGSIDNFLLSLHPTIDIYWPSGLNTNYFYLNTGQETFPNGMGMGGQLNYFGLWLDCEYGQGHSMAKPLSTTYQSPTLSHQPKFKYTDLEVWAVTNIQEDLEKEAELAEKAANTSILDIDPGAKAILEMIGKGHASDGLRESDPMASNPEETKFPVL